jgi:nicotinamide-nucleotide amidase
MSISVELISIGNELLIGKISNTNAHWLAQQITKLGALLTRITTIPDHIPTVAQTINEAIARKPHYIITTGGLGPTFDDKTFQGIAQALNYDMAVNSQALEMVKQKCQEYAKKRGLSNEIDMTPSRIKMAVFPQNTQPVTNPVGTAPALYVKVNETVLFSLPGVPLEMEAIFSQTIAPQIVKSVGGVVFSEKSVFAYDIAEANLAPLIDKVMADNVGVYVKSHPMWTQKRRIELHLTLLSRLEELPKEKLSKAAEELKCLIEVNGGFVSSE